MKLNMEVMKEVFEFISKNGLCTEVNVKLKKLNLRAEAFRVKEFELVMPELEIYSDIEFNEITQLLEDNGYGTVEVIPLRRGVRLIVGIPWGGRSIKDFGDLGKELYQLIRYLTKDLDEFMIYPYELRVQVDSTDVQNETPKPRRIQATKAGIDGIEWTEMQ